MPENIFLDGLGSFNHNTKNAGAIKWGEFNNAAVNTGSIVLSAVFTGSSVNSGTIGDLMPVYTVSVFQANSGKWESTYSTVAANSSTWGQGGGGSSDWDSITNKPTEFNPSTHSHTVSEITGLEPVVTWVSQNSSASEGADAYALIVSNSATWSTVPDTSLGNAAYTLITNNSATWETSNWSSITNKPTEFAPSSHFHHASSINAGVLDPARMPVINTSIQVISQGGLADLTQEQQDSVVQGAIVTTTDGQRYVYVGGTKTIVGSYIALADITPDWNVISNKPLSFAPSSHTHAISEVTGLQSTVTWVAENSANPAIINYIFDNNAAAVNVNSKGSITIPSNFNITEWKIITDTASTTTITLNKSTYDSYPSMTSVGSVTLTSGRKNINSSPGFANLSANDILEFLVSANSAATKITVSLKGYKI